MTCHKILSFILCVILTILMVSCAAVPEKTVEATETSTEQASVEFFAMNTYMTINIAGRDAKVALEETKDAVLAIEKQLSKTLPESEVALINGAGGEPVAVSKETYTVISEALYYSDQTDGAFDITVGPLMELWGFVSGNYHVPSQDEIKLVLGLIDSSPVVLDPEKQTVCLTNKDMQIDLGGIAKGYTSNRIREILSNYKIDSAMISLGGNVSVYGKKSSGELWRIGITDPADRNNMIGVVQINDGSVITSGGYERFFEENGKKYIHIMDPKTGSPVESDLLSVSIIGIDGSKGDCLSTALFVMGREKAISYWKEHPDFSFVLCDTNGRLYISSDLAESFSATDPDREIVLVEK